jgi:hypothetical protein
VLHDRRLHALGRLVEDHQGRIADQRAADGQLLLLAPRHGARDLPPTFLQPWKILVDEFRQLLAPGPADQFTDLQVLLDTHLRKHIAPLRDIAEAGARPGIGLQQRHILIHESDGAPPRIEEPDQASHQRRLADAIAADHADDLAAGDRHAHALKNWRGAVARPEFRYFENLISGHGSSQGKFRRPSRPE